MALLVGGLLLLSGTLLLGLNYLLVRAALPPLAEDSQLSVVSSTPAPAGSTNVLPDSVPDGSGQGGLPTGGATVISGARYQEDVLNTLLLQSGITLVITATIALVLGRVAATRLLRPVREVSAAARRLSADSLDRRLAMKGPADELTELADTFDDMLDRLADSFDSQRRFVANASHELRTPLAAQRTMMEVTLARPHLDQITRELCGRLLTMNVRSEALIDGLLVLAGSDRGLEAKHDVQLDVVARQVISAYVPEAERNGVRLAGELRPWVVRGERVLLERLITNLVDNGIKYNNGGIVVVRIGTGTGAVIEVENTGPVLPAEAVPTLFEPFVRLPKARIHTDRGVGLGLSIVASIARAHGGTATASARPGGGLVVRVSLPSGA